MAALSPAAIESLAGEILASASLGPHAVFSLRADAGRDAFKARYRELARALHPDKAKSRAAEEAFKVVTESFRAVAAGTDLSRVGRGGGCAGARPDDGPRETQHNRAPFWRVRGEDAAAAPPRWSAAANGSSANASSKKNGAFAFEKKRPERYSGAWYAPSDANASGSTREASPSPVTHVEPNDETVERFENGAADDDAPSMDPARSPTPSRTRAWFDLDGGGANDAKVTSKPTNPKTTHGRWNDSRTRGHAVFVSSTVPSARVSDEPFPYGDDPYGNLEDAPERDDGGFAEDSVFGGEKVWATGPGAEPRAKGAADFRGWGDAAAGRAARTHRRGAWSAAPKTRAPLSASAPGAPGADFRGFDVADVGDPSELERLACEGNDENERFGVVDGNDENDDAALRARTKQNARDEDAPSGAAKPSNGGGGAEAGKTNPTKAGSRKRGRSKKAAKTEVPAAPRPRLAALDEPRIPHTKLPRQKFAQATLAFS